MKWFRFYSEFRSDPKMRRMPIAHRYAFIVLLCLASESDTRGKITGLDDEDIAYELEMDSEDWQTLKAKFRVKGLIELDEGAIVIKNWDKRQFASDSSAERVARHREKQKKQSCNVTETLAKRHVTPSDTDTDSYADSNLSPLPLSEQVSESESEQQAELGKQPVEPEKPTPQASLTRSVQQDDSENAVNPEKGTATLVGNSLNVENWSVKAPFWSVHVADWHNGPGYQPEMLQAVAEIHHSADFTKLLNGKRNDPSISRHLRKLESAAKTYFGDESINARQTLLDYWAHAKTIAEREQQADQVRSLATELPSIAEPAPADYSTQRIQTLTAMLQRGELSKLQRLLTQHPEWGLTLSGNQLMEVSCA